MLLCGMREIFGQVTFTVLILIFAFAEICIALSANMRVQRALVMTFHLLPAFIAEEISVFTVTVPYLAGAGGGGYAASSTPLRAT